MKILFTLLFTCMFLPTGIYANTNYNAPDSHTTYYNPKSFIFIEQGVEFSIFQDGQFDFYMPSIHNTVNFSINSPHANFSFNTGYNYNPYVQYDQFGAIIQIQNIPLFYDYYGRISRIGNVFINYNSHGFVSLIGNMNIFYSNRTFSHCSGFINTYNRHYVYRPWHNHYRIPPRNYCVVYHTPYRRNYKPVRHKYTRPYYNQHSRPLVQHSKKYNSNRNTKTYSSSRTSKNNTRYTTNSRHSAENKTRNYSRNSSSNRTTTTNKTVERGRHLNSENFNTNNRNSKQPKKGNSRTYTKRDSSQSQNIGMNTSNSSNSRKSRR
ncbi:hypothetical protein [Formosa sp. S-31]|uniref:hypothetical protein n=1 Tax=Formosa sp. S-31 TaxID=2790949 RepID=UPI003EBA63F5